MPEFFHTRDMEEAVRTLAASYGRVFVRAKHKLWHPIRIDRAALADLSPRIVMNAPAFDGELHAWNREGGVMIYYRAFRKTENIAAHHAQLVVECPFSVEWLQGMAEGTREVVVVYAPPNWSEHERGVRDLWPDAKLCEAFYRTVERAERPSEEMRTAIGVIEEGRMVVDRDMGNALGITTAAVNRIRDTMLRPREFKMVNRVTLRIEPQHATLAQVYRYIEREFPKVGNEYIIVGARLSRAMRFWRMALKSLARQGAIALHDQLHWYALDGLEPDWKKIAKRHEKAKADMRALAEYVEALPEFSLQPTRSRRSHARPAASPRSFAASP